METRFERERGLQRLLLSAATPAELDRLIDEHAAQVTPQFVDDALAEVQGLLSGQPRVPQPMIPAGAILAVAVSLAWHLDDARLKVDAVLLRARMHYLDGVPVRALEDVLHGVEVAAVAGDARQAGRCLSIAGDLMIELDADDLAIEVLGRALDALAGLDADELLATVHESLVGIHQRRGDDDRAAAHVESSVRHRVAADQFALAVPGLHYLVGRYLDAGDAGRALQVTEVLLAGTATPAVVDEQLVDLLSWTAVDQTLAATPEIDFARTGTYRRQLDRDRLEAARRWVRAARSAHQRLPSAVDAEGRAFLDLADARLAVLEGERDAARSRAERALAWFAGRDRPEQHALALTVLMEVAEAEGDIETAARLAEEAVAVPDLETGRRVTLRIVQARSALDRGDAARSRDWLTEAIELAGPQLPGGDRRAIGPWSEAELRVMGEAGAAWAMLATVHARLGDLDAALAARARAARMTGQLEAAGER